MEVEMKIEIEDTESKKAKLVLEYKDTDEGILDARITVLHLAGKNSWDGHAMKLTQKTLDDLRSALFGLEFIRPGEDDDED